MLACIARTDKAGTVVTETVGMKRFARNTAVTAFFVGVRAPHLGTCHHRALRRLTGRVLARAVIAMLVADTWLIAFPAVIKVGVDIDAIGIELSAAVDHGICTYVCAGKFPVVFGTVITLDIGKWMIGTSGLAFGNVIVDALFAVFRGNVACSRRSMVLSRNSGFRQNE